MKNLNIFYSNRQEILIQALARELKTPLASVFSPEIIVVQSKGMERWLNMELARLNNIAANVRFPFPISLIYELFQNLIPDLPEEASFNQSVLTWQLMHILPRLEHIPEFEPLTTYLHDPGGLKLVQLSRRIALLFDQYLIFRPEMILEWDQGMYRQFSGPAQNHADWQGLLWQKLTAKEQGLHRAGLKKKFHQTLDAQQNMSALPERICLFGISSLPRYHLEILDHLARHIQINIFFLNPSPYFWGDLPSKKEQSRTIKKGRFIADLDQENDLLASWGELGRDFLDTIYSLDLNPQEIDLFHEPEQDCLLGHLQRDMFYLEGKAEQARAPRTIEKNDFSVRIHSCHSPRREIEVLQDALLGILENNPHLEPGDILVMTPDIDEYAPYIQAVFGCPESEHKQLPFCLADQDLSRKSQLSAILLQILDLSQGRLSVSEVLSVLESPIVHSNFNLSTSDLALIKDWIQDVRICWGEDQSTKEQEGLPGFKANTWEAGLERLLLGYSLCPQENRMFSKILPYEHIEGSQANVLENFLDFIQVLFNFFRELKTAKSISQWQGLLFDIMDRLLNIQAEQEAEQNFLRQAVTDMAQQAQKAGFEDQVEMRVIYYQLKQELKEKGYGYGFLSSGITFCSMLPMRSIPFAVLCLVGMNHTSFPRQDKKPEFDLMAARPVKGDRSPRMDDRYLFLETLLSARDFLHISYTGQNIKDNSTIPPSVVLSELLDYIEENFQVLEEQEIRSHILIKHPLQAFDPDYFHPLAQLRSFSEQNLKAALKLSSPACPSPFITRPLSEPDQFQTEVNLKDLHGFFKNPSKFLLEKCLGLRLTPSAQPFKDVEPLWDLDGLSNYQIGQELVFRQLYAQDSDYYELLTAQGELPHGKPGQIKYQEIKDQADDLTRKVTDLTKEMNMLKPQNIELSLENIILKATLKNLYPAYLLHYRFAKIKAKDLFSAWLEHLVLNACSLPGLPLETVLIGTDKTLKLKPVSEAQLFLTQILNNMHQGLSTPLPFFPKTSSDYAERIHKGQSRDKAMSTAQKTWAGNRFQAGEGKDEHFDLCFKELNPLSEHFEQTAITLFSPLFDHLE